MTPEALRRLLPAAALFVLSSCDSARTPVTEVVSAPAEAAEAAPTRRTSPYEGALTPVHWPGETHLANVRQLTFAGENAEAYWSADGRKLIFQSTRPPHRCDQIFVVDVESPGEPRLVSTGKGRTTCAYFFPDGERILYASTHLGGRECPPPPDMSEGYVWALYPDFDIFSARPDGSDLRRLTTNAAYDAEATVSTDGKRIVFTSVRDGDLDLYSMNADGGDVRRLTRSPGYDGGAFFSDDGAWIVYRASRPSEPEAVEEFQALLHRHLVRPSRLEIRVMRADGSDDRQVTELGAASFAPFFFRGSHERLLFVSNFADPGGRDFDVWAVNTDGTDLERITYNPTFDGFPMLSPDGRRIAFCSNRHNAKPNETNVFVADWVP
jgi:Tol biopolymer transport system component